MSLAWRRKRISVGVALHETSFNRWGHTSCPSVSFFGRAKVLSTTSVPASA